MHTGVNEIALPHLLTGYGLSACIWLFLIWQRVGLGKRVIIGIVRMSVQLGAAGFVLSYVFAVNHLAMVLALFLMMTVFAAQIVYSGTGVHMRQLFFLVLGSLIISSTLALAIFLLVFSHPEPWYDARYLITVGGMVLGNTVNASALAFERLASEAKSNREAVESYLAMGATPLEAIMPMMKKAFKASLTPITANMSGMGIVFLPGMMTGQVLSGTDPLLAVKYQVAVMLTIFVALALNVILNLYGGYRLLFTRDAQLKSSF